MNQREIFLLDTWLVSALEGEGLSKSAQEGGFVSGLTQKISQMVSAHVDPNDKVGSLVNILGPGVFAMTIKSLGFPKIGWLTALLLNVFHVDIAGFIRGIWSELTPALNQNGKVASSIIDQAVATATSTLGGTMTGGAQELGSKSFEQLNRDLRMVKLAMVSYAAPGRSWTDRLTERREKSVSIFSRVVSWIFKVAFASAGLLIAGDVINKLVGRPNAIDGTLQHGKEAPASFTPKQTKFPVSSSYHDETHNQGSPWQEDVQNSLPAIEDMIADFVQEVYPVKDKQLILSSPVLRMMADRIAWYNHSSPNAPFIFLPKYFTSKKQIADYIIDDVAERSPQAS